MELDHLEVLIFGLRFLNAEIRGSVASTPYAGKSTRTLGALGEHFASRAAVPASTLFFRVEKSKNLGKFFLQICPNVPGFTFTLLSKRLFEETGTD